jgi:AraC family transcriptional regulator, transcriptional activator of pobA
MTVPHSDIRTYTFAESSGYSGGFALKLLEDLYQEGNLESERPHRHDYYAILFIEEGKGIHYVDFQEYTVFDRSLFFIIPGQMHQLLFFSPPKGKVILFTEDFLIANAIPEKMINDIYLFNEYGVSPPLPIAEKQMPIYQNLVDQIAYFSTAIENYTIEAVGALVELFLIQSNNHCSLIKSDHPPLQESSSHLLRHFKQLLNKRYVSAHKVSLYAAEMAVTPDYLNRSVKNLTGVSAKDHIQNKLIIEAKRALTFSRASNKELAFALGFEEAAHFNHFFKKMTGMTPGDFRFSVGADA